MSSNKVGLCQTSLDCHCQFTVDNVHTLHMFLVSGRTEIQVWVARLQIQNSRDSKSNTKSSDVSTKSADVVFSLCILRSCCKRCELKYKMRLVHKSQRGKQLIRLSDRNIKAHEGKLEGILHSSLLTAGLFYQLWLQSLEFISTASHWSLTGMQSLREHIPQLQYE